jgi:3-hydroxybutyryl-CoA dehydrogenase
MVYFTQYIFSNNIIALEGVEFIIEAATEDVNIKRDLLQKIDSKSKHDFVFATNTSSIPLSTIVDSSTSRAKKCTVGFQFGYPGNSIPQAAKPL